MANDAILKTNQYDRVVEEAVQGATTPSEAIEAMKNALYAAAASGLQAETAGAPQPAHQFKYEKELHFHEPGKSGRAPLVLRADSLEDIAALERQILYGSQTFVVASPERRLSARNESRTWHM